MTAPYWMILFLLSLGYALTLSYGKLGLAALPVLIALTCAGLLVQRKPRWRQAVGHGLFILLATGLTLHWLPGFESATVIKDAVFGTGALPYSMSLNLDEPLVGFWVLLVCPWLLVWHGRNVLMTLAVIRPLTLVACLGGAWILGLIAWAPKWPDQAWLWLANNLLLVSLTEELLFRGYIQGGLERLFGHQGLALGVGALLFGLTYLNYGWQWVYLMSVAGIGYGLAYRHGGLMMAMWCNAFVDVVHFTLFTYRTLAPA
jgi:membrane protease YdiL (CAAX protease family)